MVKIAAHAAVWSTDPAPGSVACVLEAAASIGYDFVALPLRDPARLDSAALARCVSSSGVGAIGTAGMPPGGDIGSADADARRKGQAHLERVIATARDIGIGQINGVLYGPLRKAEQPPHEDEIERSAEALAGLADVAAPAGITLCLEIVNRYETAMLNTVAQGLDYLARVGRPNLKLHIDTFHMSIEERDAPAAAEAALPRLGYYELDQSHRGKLDEGSLDLAAISRPIVAAGYNGLVGVEAFARSRLATDHANGLAIWRDHFDDGDALARHAIAFVRSLFSADNQAAHPSSGEAS